MTLEDKRHMQDKLHHERDKELLLKDICARLPYNVKCSIYNFYRDECEDETITIDNLSELIDTFSISEIKPYLFPKSYIDDNEKLFAEYITTLTYDSNTHSAAPTIKTFDFYNKHHIDYRGLIPMGLALDATDKNIY